jgi:predicted RNase H-like HicB family nuclease
MKKIIAGYGKTQRNYSAHVIVGDGIAVATGYTFDELKQQMNEALDFHLEGLKEDGTTIPPPFDENFELVFKHYDELNQFQEIPQYNNVPDYTFVEEQFLKAA